MAQTYTLAEQQEYSRRYPGLVWVNGQPYTSGDAATAAPDDSGNANQTDYSNNPSDTSASLVPADLRETMNPWKMVGLLAAAGAGGSALAGLAGLGGAAGAGAAGAAGGGAAAAPALGATALPASAAFGGLAGGTSLAAAPALGAAAAGGAGAAGGGAAAAGTGFLGTLGKYGKQAQNLSTVLGGAAGGSADSQAQRAQLEGQRNDQLNSQYGTAQNAQMNAGNLDLNRQQFAASDQAMQMKRALVASLLGKMGDVNVSVPGITNATITGGMRPSALDPAILAQIQAQGLANGTTPKTFQGGQILTPPTIPDVPKTGGNNFLNNAALAASLFGAVRGGK